MAPADEIGKITIMAVDGKYAMAEMIQVCSTSCIKHWAKNWRDPVVDGMVKALEFYADKGKSHLRSSDVGLIAREALAAYREGSGK